LDSQNKPKRRSFPYFTVLLAVALIVVLILALTSGGTDKRIENNKFYAEVEAGNVVAVRGSGVTIYGVYATNSSVDDMDKFPEQHDFYFTVTSVFGVDRIEEWLQQYNRGELDFQLGIVPTQKIEFEFRPAPESIWSTILPILYISILVVVAFFVIRAITKANGKSFDFGKNKARMENGIKITFDDVAGADEEKREMQEIVEFLKNPKKFTDLGARIPKGVLMVGPPGTGKTLLAKAIAGEANVPFFSITGSDFVEMFVGVGAARVRDLFDNAKRNMPCLIFIDEIDAVGRQRGTGLGNTNDEREQTLNQLLVQMDGFESKDGIVVIAATNRMDVLDPALLRAGRFDRRITVMKPDAKGREKILRLYAKNKPMDEGINYESLARGVPGFTGADLENVLNEAAIQAARDNRPVITQKDIIEGVSKTLFGPQKRSRVITEENRKATAYHEAGHAIVAKLGKSSKREVQEVSTITRGMALGYTSAHALEDNVTHTREMLLDELDFCMGGRAAEKIVYGQLNSGASNDIQQATEIARAMVTQLGMSEKLGSVCYEGEDEIFIGRSYQQHTKYSETTAALIDVEIKALIDNSLARAEATLRTNRKLLDDMVEVLMAKETIYTEEMDMLFSGKSAKEVIKAIEKKAKEQEEEFKKAREEKARKEKEALDQLRARALAAFNGAAVAAGVNVTAVETTEAEEVTKIEGASGQTIIVDGEAKPASSTSGKKSTGTKAATATKTSVDAKSITANKKPSAPKAKAQKSVASKPKAEAGKSSETGSGSTASEQDKSINQE